VSPPRIDQPFVVGVTDTRAGQVPCISSVLTFKDNLGAVKVRFGIGRMHYTVDPGLYALGTPGPDDPVFVSANYKLSFDRLREALPGRNGWILVLDTKGINVWCAAGKGTFGTEELLQRIASSNLEKIVNHRNLVLPQLAGPGVAAFEVKKRSAFKVVYGPIQASDIPAFLDAGLEATPAMRTKTFTAGERLVLVPVELMGAIKTGILAIVATFVISFFLSGTSVGVAFHYAYNAALALLLGILAGAFFVPLLLPWLPGRSFSVKGFLPGIVGAAVFFAIHWSGEVGKETFELYAWLPVIPAVSTYLAMNFTGSSTFTSLSGVRKEMRRAVPLQVAGATCGLVLWFSSFFIH
jgi:acetyl-CoA decarbonylase/synthase complex subunit gamma